MNKITENVLLGVMMAHTLDEKNHRLAVPNSTVFYQWEADLVSVTGSLLAHEYEIKCTLADYKRDFKKIRKHRLLQDTNGWPRVRTPNYFWYVTYGFDIEPPPYAGWIEIVLDEHKGILTPWIKKPAVRLHGGHVTSRKMETAGRLLAYRVKKLYNKTYVVPWENGRD